MARSFYVILSIFFLSFYYVSGALFGCLVPFTLFNKILVENPGVTRMISIPCFPPLPKPFAPPLFCNSLRHETCHCHHKDHRSRTLGASVQLLQIDGYSATESMSQKDYIGSTWNVDGYEWEVRVYPEYDYSRSSWVALRLIILSKPRTVEVRAHFTGRLVDPSGRLQPSEGDSISHVFHHR